VDEHFFYLTEVSGTYFDEGQSELLSHLSPLRFSDLALLLEVSFVGDQKDLDVRITVVFDFLDPVLDVIESILAD
jgi:hypothetical protein